MAKGPCREVQRHEESDRGLPAALLSRGHQTSVLRYGRASGLLPAHSWCASPGRTVGRGPSHFNLMTDRINCQTTNNVKEQTVTLAWRVVFCLFFPSAWISSKYLPEQSQGVVRGLLAELHRPAPGRCAEGSRRSSPDLGKTDVGQQMGRIAFLGSSQGGSVIRLYFSAQ